MTFRIRKYRELYVAEADSPFPRGKIGYRGEFRIVKQNAMGQINHDTGWFPNLITDHGLDALAGDNWRNYMQVGSGTTPAQYTDIALESKIGASYGAATNQGAVNAGPPTYEISQVESYYFPAGYGTGTINEVGTGTGTTSNLSTRAIVPDPVTKDAVEIMTIYHKAHMSFDLADATGQILIAGSAGGELYDYILRPMNMDATGQDLLRGWGKLGRLTSYHYAHRGNGDIGPTITDVPTGSAEGSIQTSTGIPESVDYVNHTAINRIFFGINDANWAEGIRCHRANHIVAKSATAFGWQLRVGRASDDSAIMKDNTQDINFAYQLSWDRV